MFLSRSTIDFALFNACWIANLYSAIHDLPWLGVSVTAVALTIHLIPDDSQGLESLVLLGIALSGYGWDTFLQQSSVMMFPLDSSVVPPLWLFSQWFALGLIFRDTLHWLRERYVLAALLGGTGGPLSYYSASRFGILQFGEPLVGSLLLMAVGWALLVPLYLYISGPGKDKLVP